VNQYVDGAVSNYFASVQPSAGMYLKHSFFRDIRMAQRQWLTVAQPVRVHIRISTTRPLRCLKRPQSVTQRRSTKSKKNGDLIVTSY